jgi:ubiquinone/menaquinone biosynthesis C-methylase UbiE
VRRLHHEEGSGIAGASAWAERQARYWNVHAGGYEALYQNAWSALEDRALAVQLASLALPEEPVVLDLGCGTGLGGVLLAGEGISAHYTGIDISHRMLARARQRHPDAEFVEASVEQGLETFEDETFDLVMAIFSTLSYFSDPPLTLRQAHRVLRPQGHLLISALSRRSLRRLIRMRWSVVERYNTRGAEGNPPTPAWTFTPASLRVIADQAGFDARRIVGEGVLAGVAEHPTLWSVSEMLGARFPTLSHTICLEGTKR